MTYLSAFFVETIEVDITTDYFYRILIIPTIIATYFA